DTDITERLFDAPVASIDSDRLLSARLTYQLENSSWRDTPEFIRFLPLYESSVRGLSEPQVCAAHRAYPPLAVVILSARGLAGDAKWSLPRLKELTSSRLPLDVIRGLNDVLLRIVVRMRLTSEGEKALSGETPLTLYAAALLQAGDF